MKRLLGYESASYTIPPFDQRDIPEPPDYHIIYRLTGS